MTTTPTMQTCTVVVDASGNRCGKTALVVFGGSTGEQLGECVEHAVVGGPATIPTVVVEAITIRTRSRAPFALVKGSRIVGYAHSQGPRVLDRAARMGARIVPIVSGRVAVA